nr:hypothetical protein [Tanacetum cinerariifolium]
MKVEDAGQCSGTKTAKIMIKSNDRGFGPSKKTGKAKISKKQKVLGSPFIDNDVNVNETADAKQTDNEEDAEESDDVEQALNKIPTMPILNTSTRSKKKEADKERSKKEEKEEQLEKKRKIEEERKRKQEEDKNRKEEEIQL